ncbi:hypothetical protein KVR01_006189 [Diaporthe batatas]|uniref:uncharacterized protein n=1 Tax=Diaporthe batatas TaxID=748121 RepID=UPI001D037918|nr:uncharacterized protein KVR01_006189 [Diaporthe batatas]KAG8164271.1 hypothetical protein KVR01_006189 [Diaporthe batatas]
MGIDGVQSLFAVLGTAGLILLWGNMVINGAMAAMLDTSWNGIFPDGSALKMSYTGIPPLDLILRILVTFFYPLMTDRVPYLVILDIVAAMLVINIMILVESRRTSAPSWLRSCVQWQYQLNGAGVAVFLPLYSILFLKHRSPGRPLRLLESEAQAVPMTALWSLLLPIPLLMPAISGATPFQIQNGLVIYFFTPILFAMFHTAAGFASSRMSVSTFPGFVQPVRTAYEVVGVASAVIHFGILAYALSSTEPGVSLTGLYYPDSSTVQRAGSSILRAGGLLFSQWDVLITTLATLLLAVSRQQSDPGSRISAWTLTGITAALGPGAALAYALWNEEDR